MVWPQKGCAGWTGDLDAVADADLPAKRRRHPAVFKPADVKMQQPIVGGTLERIRRAVESRREVSKLHLAILTRQVAKRLRQLDIDPHDIGRQRHDAGHLS